MKNSNQILIRAYEEQDAPFLAAIYFNTIHKINVRDYSPEQIIAWVPTSSVESLGF